MTPDDLRYLTDAERAAWARCEAATPGPWSEFCEAGDWWLAPVNDPSNMIAGLGPTTTQDLLFLVESRADLPAALETIARPREALGIIRDRVYAGSCGQPCAHIDVDCEVFTLAADALTTPLPAVAPPVSIKGER